jgi:energy-coupling factor transporter transmembrane protein EcfT
MERLDPRGKLLFWLVLLQTSLVLPPGWPLLGYLGLLLALVVAVGGTHPAWLYLAGVVLPTAVMLLVVHGTLLPREDRITIFGLQISPAGLEHGLDVSGRILVLGLSTIIFVKATPVTQLAAGLAALGLPQSVAAMIVSSFCLSGDVSRRIKQIAQAQRARGLWPRGLFLGRVRAYLPILQPLVNGLILGAIERSALWQSRGYLAARPRLARPWSVWDTAVVLLGVVLLLSGWLTRWLLPLA